MNVRAASVDGDSASDGRATTAISEAFYQFEGSIYPSDARAFRSTTLQQVKDAAKIIERDQAKRRCLRNLRRIKPVFEALARFGGSIETLCQGTPFLCFIWAPVKLLLTIADEYTSGFEKLVEAYSQIAHNLPRFDRLSDAFKEQPDFQAVLADVYADLLEFHFHAYKFLRRSGWKHLWEASWRGFSSRFNTILQNMNRSRDLVDKEAASFEILEAKSMRDRLLAALEQSEAQKREWQLRDSLAWLDLQGHDREQDDLLERCATSRQQGTCEWFLRHAKIVAWLDEEDQRNTLWLKGKPGAGKTTLAAYLLQAAPISPQASIFYCLCPDRLTYPGKSVCGLIFRSLVAQLIRVKSEVLPFIYETFVKLGATPSLPRVRDLLRTILRSPGITYIIFDGLDECESADQTHVLSELQNLPKPDTRTKDEKLKVLICSRETKEISRKLNQTLQISLSDERQDMSGDISKFTEFSLAELSDRFSAEIINEVSGEVVKKADGMFLWVRLVLSTLLDQESISDLREAVHRLPIGLESAYGSILNRIQAQMDESQRVKAKAILSWLAFAYRPLQSFELCDALVFSEDRVLDEQTKLGKGVLDICKPLIEEREGHVFALVHFSAREYLLSQKSGPFLPSLRAQSDITQTCLRYLATCRIFLVEPASTIARQQIVKELHSLFPYVNKYWLRHMLALIKISQTLQNSSAITSMIQGAVDMLTAFARDQVPAQTSSSNILEVELAGLSKEVFASLPSTLQQYLQFRGRVASLPGNQARATGAIELLSSIYLLILQSKIAPALAWNQKISDVFKKFTDLQDIFAVFLDVEEVSWVFHQRLIETVTNLSILHNFALQKHRLKYHTSVNEVPLPRFGHRRPIAKRDDHHVSNPEPAPFLPLERCAGALSDIGRSTFPNYDSKGYVRIYEQIWRDMAKRDLGKVHRIKAASLSTRQENLRKLAQLASKQARKWQERTNKSMKDTKARAKRTMREMMSFWKRNEREERDLRRMAERKEIEDARKAEGDREANRQKRKLNFLISQTELHSHFIGRKIKTDEVKRATDDPEVATPNKKIQPSKDGAPVVSLPDSNTDLSSRVRNFEDLDFDAEDETALNEAAMANAQNAIQEAQHRGLQVPQGL